MPLEDVVEPLNDTNPGQRRGSQQLPNFRARGIDLQSTAILPLVRFSLSFGVVNPYPLFYRMVLREQ